jgi:ribosomal protein S18 acetylase RimI-like enzyme
VLEGEFGRRAPGLLLEVISVRGDATRLGVGAALLDALCDHGRRHRLANVFTQAAWNDHSMVRWLDAMAFRLAPNHVVDCDVNCVEYAPERDDPTSETEGNGATREVNYGAPANDYERLARDNADVRAMEPADLADIVRIDRSITGRDRHDYMRQKHSEAMHDSAIRVSLTARLDGIIVGFVMARADLGDFGRTEPVAVVDTIGVDAGYSRRGIGHALLSQLFANLGALRIEQVETTVAPHDLALLGFLYSAGFAPSQRLSFMRRFA